MNENKNKKELELGKYLESDMLALTEDEVSGGTHPTVSVVITVISAMNGCPTQVCTRAC